MDSPIAPTSLRDALVTEHEVVAALLAQVIAAIEQADGDGASTAWTRFREALLAHLAAQDTYLIPTLPRAYETNARVLTQEHQHIRERLSDLHRAPALDAGALGNLRMLYDVLVAHTRNDDRLLYDWIEAQMAEPERGQAIERITTRVARARS